MQQQLVWWWHRRGATVSAVARLVAVSRAVVERFLNEHGGIAPHPRRRHPQALTPSEREDIFAGLAAGWTYTAIAAGLGRWVSTVSREVARNGGREHYRPAQAEQAAAARARRPKASKLADQPQLAAWITDRLLDRWSPRQIAARLPQEFPHDAGMRLSHETIYRSLYVQSRGEFRHELTRYLRQRHSRRRPQGQPGETRGRLPDAVPLSARPAEADDRAVPGHWEGDLILGRGGSAIATLVERHSRFVLLTALPQGKTAEAVAEQLASTITRLPSQLRRSLTWDQGKEMAQHAWFSVATGLPVYFCPPGTPWLRGSNENTNRLLRDFLPKGTDLSTHSQADLDTIATTLNTRPRWTLNWATPAETLHPTLVAPTP
ncbi:IS30-like element ISCfr4 family transposase [Salinifilum aidingensis]